MQKEQLINSLKDPNNLVSTICQNNPAAVSGNLQNLGYQPETDPEILFNRVMDIWDVNPELAQKVISVQIISENLPAEYLTALKELNII